MNVHQVNFLPLSPTPSSTEGRCTAKHLIRPWTTPSLSGPQVPAWNEQCLKRCTAECAKNRTHLN